MRHVIICINDVFVCSRRYGPRRGAAAPWLLPRPRRFVFGGGGGGCGLPPAGTEGSAGAPVCKRPHPLAWHQHSITAKSKQARIAAPMASMPPPSDVREGKLGDGKGEQERKNHNNAISAGIFLYVMSFYMKGIYKDHNGICSCILYGSTSPGGCFSLLYLCSLPQTYNWSAPTLRTINKSMMEIRKIGW